jgi:antitoxin component YwqK of YwqJK toxin-antitoxin module
MSIPVEQSKFMKNLFLILFLSIIIFGCKTISVNQKVNKKREGLWIEQYAIDSTQYKSVGKYKNGDPTKKWLYYINNTINKKEIYRKNRCTITYYNVNGTIQSKGKTKLIVTGSETHWFYYGDWKYFDEKGNLISTRKYENGEFVSEIKTSLLTKEEIKLN